MQQTKKLYDDNPYQTSFDASVLSCEPYTAPEKKQSKEPLSTTLFLTRLSSSRKKAGKMQIPEPSVPILFLMYKSKTGLSIIL